MLKHLRTGISVGKGRIPIEGSNNHAPLHSAFNWLYVDELTIPKLGLLQCSLYRLSYIITLTIDMGIVQWKFFTFFFFSFLLFFPFCAFHIGDMQQMRSASRFEVNQNRWQLDWLPGRLQYEPNDWHRNCTQIFMAFSTDGWAWGESITPNRGRHILVSVPRQTPII